MLRKLVVLLTVTSVTVASSQVSEEVNPWSVGFSLSQAQRDFGTGVHVVSPVIADIASIKGSMTLAWNEFIPRGGEATEWAPYTSMQFGLRSEPQRIAGDISLYGEGGFFGILPNSRFTNETFVPGGYGLFGFQFTMQKRAAYFIEIGGVGSGATAELATGRPIYSNGLFIATGFRLHL